MENKKAIAVSRIVKEIVESQRQIDYVTERQDDLIKRIEALQKEPTVDSLSLEGENESNQIWNQAKQEIKKRLSITRYNTWFKNLEVVECENKTMSLKAENEFIEKALNFITGEDWTVTFVEKEDPYRFDNIWE
ncbi:MAG: DnaA N-terminal domain-containing protein [Bacillota bacterium]|nr:DnaA N-terminal domain-containing protein [Bacillota bacterium]